MAFADMTALLVAHITPIVAPVPVSADVPDPRPVEFVQIRRIGGPATPPVRDSPNIDFVSWAVTSPQAMATLLTIRAALYPLAGSVLGGLPVYRLSELLGPAQRNDPVTGTPMALMSITFDVRADDVVTQFT